MKEVGHCPNCAAEIAPGDIVCPRCLKRVEGRAVSFEAMKELSKKTIDLVECPDCLSKVSRRAKACPHCGYRETSAFTDIFVVILVLLGFFVVFSNTIAGILLWILAAIIAE